MNKISNLKGFTPLLIFIFLNTIIDFGHKIVLQNMIFEFYQNENLFLLNTALSAVMLLPFIFLFAPAGIINDKFSQDKILKICAGVELILAILTTISYAYGIFIFAAVLAFLMSLQASFYIVARYAYIKKISSQTTIGVANATTQIVIMAGIIVSVLSVNFIFQNNLEEGMSLAEMLNSFKTLGVLFIFIAFFELVSSFWLVCTPKIINENLKTIAKNSANIKQFKSGLSILKSNKDIYLSILGLGLFWGITGILLAVYPFHINNIISSSPFMINSFLIVGAFGFMFGSFLAKKLSRNHIELGIIPISAIGLFISLLLFACLESKLALGICLVIFGFFGGLLVVPLNTIIQFFSHNKNLGKVLAGSNLVQAIFMLGFLGLCVLFNILDLSSSYLLGFASIILLIGGFLAIKRVPHLFARLILVPIFKSRFNLYMEGVENIPNRGSCLLLGNHISWIDWLILQVACPRPIKFVLPRKLYEQKHLTWFLKIFKVIPIGDGEDIDSIKIIKDKLNNGEVVAIFPEGHISYNGQLNEFKRGFELIAKDVKTSIVPFYLRGLWGSSFSRATKHYKLVSSRRKREVIVAFGAPLPNDTKASEVRQKVLELSFSSWDKFIDNQEPFHLHWLRSAKSNLSKISVVDNIVGSLSNAKFIIAVLIFVKLFKKELKGIKTVGVVLPSSAIGSIINMALFAGGKIPININFTQSEDTVDKSIKKAEVSKIITSKKFLQKIKEKGFDFDNIFSGKIIFVEDLKPKITKGIKIRAALEAYLAPIWLIDLFDFAPIHLDDTATILFSSGSEGEPKGIELTHKNLLTNVKQVSELLNAGEKECILNSLPLFHSFGLTITTLLPLCEGLKMVSVPDPTDAYEIGKMAARHGATVLFGTSTFFRIYNKNRKLNPLMFKDLRYVVAGAEKLKPEVKRDFRLKFGHEIYEGYGTTETAPVASCNMPNMLDPENLKELTFNRPGSIGMSLPGTIIKIIDPDTNEELPFGESGLIVIGGGQVMKGYLKDPKKTAEVIIEIDGTRYYKTGDKGYMDESGFIFIVDRYSRFAKIGGEMISLGAVEENVAKVFDSESQFIAVNLPDEKKGEKIILLAKSDLNLDEIKERISLSNLNALMTPSEIYLVDDLPILASGKINFTVAKDIAKELSK